MTSPRPDSCFNCFKGGAARGRSVAALRAKALAPVLLGEHMGEEVGDPLHAFDGPREVLQRVADVGLDRLPEEARIMLGDVGGRAIAETLGDAGLDELVIEGIQLARVERVGYWPIRSIAEVANQDARFKLLCPPSVAAFPPRAPG